MTHQEAGSYTLLRMPGALEVEPPAHERVRYL